MLDKVFVIREEEELVSHFGRSSEYKPGPRCCRQTDFGATSASLREPGNDLVRFVPWVEGIQGIVLHEFESLAMELIGASFGLHHQCGDVVANRGGEVGNLNRSRTQRFDGRLKADAALVVVIDVDAFT